MKHLKLIAMVLVLAVTVSACGIGGGKTESKTKENKETATMEEKETEDMENKDASGEKMMKDQDSDEKMMADSEDKDKEMEKEMKNMGENKGDMAMDFTLKDKDGKEFTLSEEKGKKVYVKYWASWCSICLAGLEELDELAGMENDFEIVSIVSPNARGEKSQEEFMQWFDTLGYKNLRVLFDEGGEVASTYGVRGYPTSAFIGSDGVLVNVRPGHVPNEEIKKAFSEIK